MNRILAKMTPCWLLIFALIVPVALTAQEKAAEPEPTAKADEHAKGDAGAAATTKAAEEHAAPALRPTGVAGDADASGEQAAGDHPASAAAAAPAHDHGHGDPNDLSHGDSSSQLKAPLELRFDLAIASLIIFLLLAAILAKFAWKPIVAGLDKREQTIAKQIADAEHASAMAAKQLQEYERKLAAATEEARAIVGQARQDAMTAKDKLVAEAQAAAAKERDRAVADITSAKNQALQEIAQKSVSTAIALASNIVRREVKPEDHDKLIHESLQKFSSLN